MWVHFLDSSNLPAWMLAYTVEVSRFPLVPAHPVFASGIRPVLACAVSVCCNDRFCDDFRALLLALRQGPEVSRISASPACRAVSEVLRGPWQVAETERWAWGRGSAPSHSALRGAGYSLVGNAAGLPPDRRRDPTPPAVPVGSFPCGHSPVFKELLLAVCVVLSHTHPLFLFWGPPCLGEQQLWDGGSFLSPESLIPGRGHTCSWSVQKSGTGDWPEAPRMGAASLVVRRLSCEWGGFWGFWPGRRTRGSGRLPLFSRKESSSPGRMGDSQAPWILVQSGKRGWGLHFLFFCGC